LPTGVVLVTLAYRRNGWCHGTVADRPTYYALAMHLREKARKLSAIANNAPASEVEARLAAVLKQASSEALRRFKDSPGELTWTEIRTFLSDAEKIAWFNPSAKARGATQDEITAELTGKAALIMHAAAARPEQTPSPSSSRTPGVPASFAALLDGDRPIVIQTNTPSKDFMKAHAAEGLRPELPQSIEVQGGTEIGQGHDLATMGDARRRIQTIMGFFI
jgi:hypothetical protein